MAEYTRQELREQASRAGRYFGEALSVNDKAWIGVRFGDTMLLVTSGPLTDKIVELVEGSGLLGKDKKIELPDQ